MELFIHLLLRLSHSSENCWNNSKSSNRKKSHWCGEYYWRCRKTTTSRSVWFTSHVNVKPSLGDVLQVKVADKRETRRRVRATGTNSKSLSTAQGQAVSALWKCLDICLGSVHQRQEVLVLHLHSSGKIVLGLLKHCIARYCKISLLTSLATHPQYKNYNNLVFYEQLSTQ